jgi:DNA polymerase-3 subunit delta'
MRDLEKSLYLKPFKAPMKVAVVVSAERMCLGQAEAANAFLKTLEEPPAATLILMTTTRPQLLLPTILSRCLRLDLLPEELPAPSAEIQPLLTAWFNNKQTPALRAYARAAALTGYWQKLREKLEDRELPTESEGVTEEALKALVEGEFQLARQDAIATIQREYWRRAIGYGKPEIIPKAMRCIVALEELQQSLAQNIDQNLSVERAILVLEGLI